MFLTKELFYVTVLFSITNSPTFQALYPIT
jgi:hypothetical protein